MKILTIGSLHLDHVYWVPHFVRLGETLASDTYQCGLGFGDAGSEDRSVRETAAELLTY